MQRPTSLGLAAVRWKVEPLLDAAITTPGPGITAAKPEKWFLLAAPDDFELNPWEVAHQAVTADPELYVEPDLLQTWEQARSPVSPFAATETPAFDDQDKSRGELGPRRYWHLDDDFSQLEKARDSVPESDRAKVTIMHLDTGILKAHITRPTNIDFDKARNFLDNGDPKDPEDRASGLVNNMGHGTGTISILAGAAPVNARDPMKRNKPMGGAAGCRIVPVRVANSVVQFHTSTLGKGLAYGLECGAHVITMSLGGVPSALWADAVNRLYEAGVVVVAAAGNRIGVSPPFFIVYPARFERVIAACGVMANNKPYDNIGLLTMQGCFGPDHKMETAISAYTPNTAWADNSDPLIVDHNGRGTSAATPQVAAAAALYIAKHIGTLGGVNDWRRVEAVRRALFSKAVASKNDFSKLGKGVMRAADSLTVAPKLDGLKKLDADTASFGFFRVLTGLGAEAQPPGRNQLFDLEAAQLSLIDSDVARAWEDARSGDETARIRLLQAIEAAPSTSMVLRRASQNELRRTAPDQEPAGPAPEPAPQPPRKRVATVPPHRRLRVYAYDPTLGQDLETTRLNEAVLNIRWEDLEKTQMQVDGGPLTKEVSIPAGKYLEVVDVDPPSKCAYEPVDLDSRELLAQDGLPPSEGSPQFHQQMVYAVAMRTIEHFETALGRTALWAPRINKGPDEFVERLRIYPHALCESNAYYSPEHKALLFGYFLAGGSDVGRNLPGGVVFTCLSHDIIVHETTHALLDGLHRRFIEDTNPDVLAFHEAFADIAALFQHFTMPEVLRFELAKYRGDLGSAQMLAGLARQFGEATGKRGALRSAIGEKPDPAKLETVTAAHERGAILVAAVFDAFLTIYRAKTADLVRLATSGTGVLSPGEIHPDLVERLSMEASEVAGHVLRVCVRALDYCPPVDLTFGEYLRAIITADLDLAPDDPDDCRVAFIEAFRRRGIFPRGVRSLSVESLRWQTPDHDFDHVNQLLAGEATIRAKDEWGESERSLDLRWSPEEDRRTIFDRARENQRILHAIIRQDPDNDCHFGLMIGSQPALLDGIKPDRDGLGTFEVHSIRPSRRYHNEHVHSDLIAVITQRRSVPIDPDHPERGTFWFRGGCTLIYDLDKQFLKYAVVKDIRSESRLKRQRNHQFLQRDGSLRALYFGRPSALVKNAQPFALLHEDVV